ncbi:MAG: TIGR02646 family protein [Methylococcaceae bacterium]|nr:TIGR02646 family protein [Methylococcaceae bacterium]
MKYLPQTHNIPYQLAQRRQATPAPENPTTAWNSFKGNAHVIEALFYRQHGLCAYCEIELELMADKGIGRHIEHILPKSLNSELTFEYSNMLLSCFSSGGEITATANDPAPISCGHANSKKANNWDVSLFIKPTDNDCERYFSVELDGEIIPHPQLTSNETQHAHYTIELLNLNCLRLKRLREEIIIEGYNIINELQGSSVALENFLKLEMSEVNGKLREFINLRKQHFR